MLNTYICILIVIYLFILFDDYFKWETQFSKYFHHYYKIMDNGVDFDNLPYWIFINQYQFIVTIFFWFSQEIFIFFITFFTYFLSFGEDNLFFLKDVILSYKLYSKGIRSVLVFTDLQNEIFFKHYVWILLNDFYLGFLSFFNETPVFFFGGCFFLLSTILSLLLMSYLGLYGVFITNLITLFIFWLSVIVYFNDFFIHNIFFKINIGKWFTILNNLNVFFELNVDSISYSFMLLTVTIALFVYIYVYSYFRYDANVERLILFINCFVISMVILVVSGNFFVLFLGWELIGLTSFLLINFWSTRISTLKSAFKAYVFNKFSDVSMLIAIILAYIIIQDISIVNFNNQISLYKNYYVVFFGYDISIIELISFFFISAAFVKSAQFGAHIWLPDSMEAPVPASALIHSATLVSAGVFLLLRFAPLFELSSYVFYLLPLVGSFTAFFGGICAAYQSDLKRILAYSTISHCGFLMVTFSTFVPEFTILYLYIHGFFKAAVFLCAGNMIRFSRNYQDFRRMGLFWKYLPFEFFASFVCLMNLCGLPFTLGFYIKHLLVLSLSVDSLLFYFIFINIVGGAISGLFYSYKFFYYSFLDVKKAKKIIYTSSNSENLKSNFYSNTSLASNLSIFFLIIVSYFISINLFNIFLNKNSIGEGLDIHGVYSSLNLELLLPTFSFLFNVSLFNWLILIITVLIIFFNVWRKKFFLKNLFYFNILIVFFIFMYLII